MKKEGNVCSKELTITNGKVSPLGNGKHRAVLEDFQPETLESQKQPIQKK